jgi:hypothetical protein
MPELPVRDPALEYFYFGFYRALRRFREATVAGWCIAGAGVALFALRWEPVWSGDLAGGLLCALLIVAGILLVQQSVAGLTCYAHIPFPLPSAVDDDEGSSRAVAELAGVVKDVEEGGWQDAMHALAVLRSIGERYGLPEPDGTPRKPAVKLTTD